MPSISNYNNVNSTVDLSTSSVGRVVSQTGRSAVINLTSSVKNNPLASFKKNPHQTSLAEKALRYEMQKNLPADLAGKKLNTDGERIKNLIGIIYEPVKSSGNMADIKSLDSICSKMTMNKDNAALSKAEMKRLSGLVKQYGDVAFEKTINTFIGLCSQSWQDHHDARSINVENKETFKACLDVCKSVLHNLAKGLNEPGLAWEQMGQKMNQFFDCCVAISKTPIHYDTDAVADSGTEPAPEQPASGPNSPAPSSPVHPASVDPTGNIGPGNDPNTQRIFIPRDAGSEGITLNITNNNTNTNTGPTTGERAAQPTGLNSEDLRTILTSDLSNTDKVKLADKYLDLNAGGRHFLTRLQHVANTDPLAEAERAKTSSQPPDVLAQNGSHDLGTLVDNSLVDGVEKTPPSAVLCDAAQVPLEAESEAPEAVQKQLVEHQQEYRAVQVRTQPEIFYAAEELIEQIQPQYAQPLSSPGLPQVAVKEVDIQPHEESPKAFQSHLETQKPVIDVAISQEQVPVRPQYAQTLTTPNGEDKRPGMVTSALQPGINEEPTLVRSNILRELSESVGSNVAEHAPEDMPKDLPKVETQRQRFVPANLEGRTQHTESGRGRVFLTERPADPYSRLTFSPAQIIPSYKWNQDVESRNERQKLESVFESRKQRNPDDYENLGSQAIEEAKLEGLVEFQKMAAEFSALRNNTGKYHDE